MLYLYDGDVEVWRCSAEFQDVDESSCQVIQEAKPTVRQLTNSARATGRYGTLPSRGNFFPWTCIQRPGRGVTRFSFPFLGVTTSEEINIWDIRTGALVQTMLNIQEVNYDVGGAIVSAEDEEGVWYLGDVNDFDLTEGYVFVCGTKSMRVFDRSVRGMGRERAVSAEVMAPRDMFEKWSFTVATDDSGKVIQKPHIGGALVVEYETVLSRYNMGYAREFLSGE